MSSLTSDSPGAAHERTRSENRRASTILAIVGGLLVWLAFPPVGAAPLAWLGAAIWVWLCRAPGRYSRGDYGGFYLAALVHWMLVVHWVRLPHWSAWIGWLALSAYVAVYLPAFIALVRKARQLGVPLVLAAPIVWSGLEALRGRAFSGFAMALLGHTQVESPALIQIADLFGAYGVSFLIVLVAAAAAEWVPAGKSAATSKSRSARRIPPRFVSSLVAAVALLGTIAYGRYRLSSTPVDGDGAIRVALIQGSMDTVFDGLDHRNETLAHYVELSRAAIAQDGPLDLLVWPESMYANEWITVDATGPMHVPNGIEQDAAAYREGNLRWKEMSVKQARLIAGALNTRMIAGAPRLEFGTEPTRRFNSALYLDVDGTLIDSYDKMHRVLFGEYIPLGNFIPWLYQLSPLGAGLTAGTTPKCFRVGEVRLATSICFENTVPHLLRRQYLALRAEGAEPDALVTITNDGWFWGSSLLDLHLTCGVFRAIELRRPLLIAANTGFSAWIDAQGQVVAQGPRRAAGAVAASLTPMGPSESVYLAWGDVPVGVCTVLCGILALALCSGRKPRDTTI